MLPSAGTIMLAQSLHTHSHTFSNIHFKYTFVVLTYMAYRKSFRRGRHSYRRGRSSKRGRAIRSYSVSRGGIRL